MPTVQKEKQLRIRFRKLGRERAAGLYWGKKCLLEVDPNQVPKEMLDTIIHEGLHHYCPYMCEDEVRRVAEGLAKLVWAIGYRRIAL